MKRLLLPLLAALALPTAVNAESYWLLLTNGKGNSYTMELIEMKDIDQCEKQGKLYLKSERIKFYDGTRGFECFEGK